MFFSVWRHWDNCSQWWYACCVDTHRPSQRHSQSRWSVANQVSWFIAHDSFWKGKHLSGDAKLETALNFTSSSLQVEAKHELSRRQNLEKKVPWTERGKPKILWPAPTDIRHSIVLQWGLFYQGVDYCHHCSGWASMAGCHHEGATRQQHQTKIKMVKLNCGVEKKSKRLRENKLGPFFSLLASKTMLLKQKKGLHIFILFIPLWKEQNPNLLFLIWAGTTRLLQLVCSVRVYVLGWAHPFYCTITQTKSSHRPLGSHGIVSLTCAHTENCD